MLLRDKLEPIAGTIELVSDDITTNCDATRKELNAFIVISVEYVARNLDRTHITAGNATRLSSNG